MTFKMLETDVDGAVIKVVGVGGGGGNAVNHMVNRGVQGVEFIAVNTDRQALARSLVGRTIQLGDAGLGAGANPEAGRAAAQAERGNIRAALERTLSLAPFGESYGHSNDVVRQLVHQSRKSCIVARAGSGRYQFYFGSKRF